MHVDMSAFSLSENLLLFLPLQLFFSLLRILLMRCFKYVPLILLHISITRWFPAIPYVSLPTLNNRISKSLPSEIILKHTTSDCQPAALDGVSSTPSHHLLDLWLHQGESCFTHRNEKLDACCFKRTRRKWAGPFPVGDVPVCGIGNVANALWPHLQNMYK